MTDTDDFLFPYADPGSGEDALSDSTEEGRRKLGALLDTFHRNLALDTNRPFKIRQVHEESPALAQFLFSGRDLRKTSFRNEDLRGMDFRGSDLGGCDFTGALIEGAGFDLAKVSRAALRRASDWDAHVRSWRRSTPRLAFPFFPGDRFSLAPHLPELTIVAPDVASVPGSDLTEEEIKALSEGRLAIAIQCLSYREWAAVHENPAANQGDAMRHFTLFQARRYFDAFQPSLLLDSRPSTATSLSRLEAVRFPSAGLLDRLARLYAASPDKAPVDEDATDIDLAALGVGRSPDGFPRPEHATYDNTPITVKFDNDERFASGLPGFASDRDLASLRPVFIMGE